MGPALFESLAALVLTALAGVTALTGLSAASHGQVLLRQEAAGTALLAAELNALAQDAYTPTGSGTYPTAGPLIPNPLGLPVTEQVANYQPGATPAFSPTYPNSGLQQVTFTVTLPTGVTLTASTYKVR